MYLKDIITCHQYKTDTFNVIIYILVHTKISMWSLPGARL